MAATGYMDCKEKIEHGWFWGHKDLAINSLFCAQFLISLSKSLCYIIPNHRPVPGFVVHEINPARSNDL